MVLSVVLRLRTLVSSARAVAAISSLPYSRFFTARLPSARSTAAAPMARTSLSSALRTAIVTSSAKPTATTTSAGIQSDSVRKSASAAR